MIRRDWVRYAASAGLAAVAGLRPTMVRGAAAVDIPLFALRRPGCNCCIGWAEHLRERGFEVHLDDSPDLDAVKVRLGIPADLHGCHTAVVEGYVVEGHVPAEFIQRLLDETPRVAGVAVPGMPIGSPGMEGPNPQPFDIIGFGAAGATGRYVFGSYTPAATPHHGPAL